METSRNQQHNQVIQRGVIKILNVTVSNRIPKGLIDEILNNEDPQERRYAINIINCGLLGVGGKPQTNQRFQILFREMVEWEICYLRKQPHFNLTHSKFLKVCSINFPHMANLKLNECNLFSIESLAYINSPFLVQITVLNNNLTNATKVLTRFTFPNLAKIQLNSNHIKQIDLQRCYQTKQGILFDIYKQKTGLSHRNKYLLAKMQLGILSYPFQTMLDYRKGYNNPSNLLPTKVMKVLAVGKSLKPITKSINNDRFRDENHLIF